jgi:hypothetical protein
MEIKCKTPKDYKLTKDKVYEANESSKENFYVITNDDNKEVNYHKDLFEEVARGSTPEEILESFRCVQNEDDEVIFDCNVIIDGENIEFSTEIDDYESRNSCGITFAEGLSDLSNEIRNNIPDRGNIRIDIAQQILHLFINESRYAAFVLFTTNTNMDGYDFINDALMSICDHSDVEHNPNSGNDIKFWMVKKGEN